MYKRQALFISPYSRKTCTSAPVLHANNTYISIVAEVRVLGVTITSNLTWSAHALRTQKSVARMLGVLNRFGSALNTNCRLRILHAFILPKLTYCTPVWCWVNKGTTNALDTTLQRAGRIVLRNRAAVLNSAMYEATDLLPFNILAQLKSLVRVHALLSRDDYQAYLPPLISEGESQHATRSASGRRLHTPEHTRTADECCFHYAASQHWNALDRKITASSSTLSTRTFSTSLIKELLRKFK